VNNPPTETALDLLKRAEALLSALHGSVARHDNLAANLGCAGCELRDQIRGALPTLAAAPSPAPAARPTPDSASPIAGRIEVREPCPWCPDRPMVPRSLMDEHVARLHPDVQTVDASPAGLVAVLPTVWIDGHPQLEAIAAAVWESCRTEESSTVVDDPRNIAVAALAAILAVPSAGSEDTTTTRADTLREAATIVRSMDSDYALQEAAEHLDGLAVEVDEERELRRLAAETQPSEAAAPSCGCPHPADEHSIYGCADGCGCEWMPKRKPMDPARILGGAEPAASAGVQTDEENNHG
jgi:hypothetical protein